MRDEAIELMVGLQGSKMTCVLNEQVKYSSIGTCSYSTELVVIERFGSQVFSCRSEDSDVVFQSFINWCKRNATNECVDKLEMF